MENKEQESQKVSMKVASSGQTLTSQRFCPYFLWTEHVFYLPFAYIKLNSYLSICLSSYSATTARKVKASQLRERETLATKTQVEDNNTANATCPKGKRSSVITRKSTIPRFHVWKNCTRRPETTMPWTWWYITFNGFIEFFRAIWYTIGVLCAK